MIEFSFLAPDDLLNANQRLHWSRRASLSRVWRDAAYIYTRKALMQQDGPRQFDHAHIVIELRFPDERRRDVNNWQPTAKAIVDGIVDAKVIPDDDDKHLTGPDLRRGRRSAWSYPQVVVTIRRANRRDRP